MKIKKFSWPSFIMGVLFLVVAFLTIWQPASSLEAVVIFIGVVAILEGIAEIFFRHQLYELFGVENRRWVGILFGICLIILGLVLLFNLKFGVYVLPYVFAIWFVLDSVENLFLLPYAREVSNGYYWFTLIAAILGIILGCWLFVTPRTSAMVLTFLIAVFFMWFGIDYIYEAFATRRIFFDE